MDVPARFAYQREADVAVAIVRDVAAKVNRIYLDQTATVYTKGDGSPVTDADLVANTTIREALAAAFPDDGLLTEETDDDAERLDRTRCWIADPIDGTAEFVAHSGEFDVMLALVDNHDVVVAVTGHPPTGTLLLAVRGTGAWRLDGPDRVAPFQIALPEEPPRLVASSFYGANTFADEIAAIAEHAGAEPPRVLGVGFQPRAFLPEFRSYDGFVGFWRENVPMREWDLAACDLIVTEAGGSFTRLRGKPFRYNLPAQPDHSGLLVSASPHLHARLVDAVGHELSPADS